MACGGCEKRREVLKEAVKGNISPRHAVEQVVKSAAQDVRDRVRAFTVRQKV